MEELFSTAQNPIEERAYRETLADTSPTSHTLRFKDELQLADHIAFLAHSQEGVHAISAACIEEKHAEITIRLASNHTPSVPTVSGLKRFFTPSAKVLVLVQFALLSTCRQP